MTSYTVADSDVIDLLNRILREHHPDLAEAGVRVGVLMAFNPEGDAVRHSGYPALACVKVVSLKDRVTKGYDVEMLIDQSAWDDMRAQHRAALVDHELTHVRRVPNSAKALREGGLKWKTDDIGRPKIKMRKGDFHCGDAFAEVIARHGDYAAEYLNIQRAKSFADAAKRGKGEAAA